MAMPSTSASLGTTHASSAGRVRLRLAHLSDRAEAQALLARLPGTEEDPDGLLRHDPRHRAVACAVALRDGRERLLGLGAIDLEPEAEPDVLHSELPDVAMLLESALRERAQTHRPPVATLSPASPRGRWARWPSGPRVRAAGGSAAGARRAA